MQNLKESWQKMPEKTRKIIKAITGGTIVIALIAILALNFLESNADYSTLFTGLNQEEAREVVSLLQNDGINYRYNTSEGAIQVPDNVVEQTRVNLLSQGYPKSGFAYDTYLDNTGLMTTESDKKLITKYELQDRLGATIRVFEGVQDAKVTITEGNEATYAWEDNSASAASASVIITMKNGYLLTTEKAQAVKTLVSHATKSMEFSNVAVFDAATMREVGGTSDGSASGASDLVSLTTLVESNIAANVRKILEPLYGTGNVAVSVKGTLNMERLVQESTQYSTPEKIDENDKTGLLETEDVASEGSSTTNQGAGGLVGADANADTPRYANADGTGTAADNYNNSSASRAWLYNMLKEQRQIDPGVLEDTSIGIVIITDNMDSPTQEQLLKLVANSAGISLDVAEDKITIIRDTGPVQEVPVIPTSPDGEEVGSDNVESGGPPLLVLIAIGAGIFLLLLILLLLLVIRKKRKKSRVALEGGDLLEGELSGDQIAMDESGLSAEGSMDPILQEVEDEFTKNEEILNLRMQRSMRLKQNIGEFVDQNPQIAAKLVQSWLRGEEDEDDGRSKHTGKRK